MPITFDTQADSFTCEVAANDTQPSFGLSVFDGLGLNNNAINVPITSKGDVAISITIALHTHIRSSADSPSTLDLQAPLPANDVNDCAAGTSDEVRVDEEDGCINDSTAISNLLLGGGNTAVNDGLGTEQNSAGNGRNQIVIRDRNDWLVPGECRDITTFDAQPDRIACRSNSERDTIRGSQQGNVISLDVRLDASVFFRDGMVHIF